MSARAPSSLARSAALLTVAAVATTGALRAALGPTGAGTILALLLALGAAALATAHVAAARRRALGGLTRQFALSVAVVIGQMAIAVVVICAVMFVSTHDAILIVAFTAFAGVIGVRAAQVTAAGVLRDVRAVRHGLSAVAEGERAIDIRTAGNDELAELARRANDMVARLAAEEDARDSAESTRRDLVAAVSHDLRTPITSLRLLADAIGDDIVDAGTRRRYLDTMTVHIDALGALIDDLFELSRLEAGEIDWSMERVRVDELVGETVAAMRVQGEAKGVALVVDVERGLEPVQANPEKVQRVLFNLIQNAIRHTPADGSVTVRAGPADGGLEVEVVDTGDGIGTADRERAFDAFFRGGSEASRTRGGAGLGLAISRAIVEAHGGRIWLEAATSGTRVRFNLPRGVAAGT